MPSDPRPKCKKAEITQISVGQAGPEVNRDLETLFAAVNAVLRCVSDLSDLGQGLVSGAISPGASGGTGGSGSGSGSGGSGGTGTGTAGVQIAGALHITSGVDFQLAEQVRGLVLINPTADITVKLPAPTGAVQIANVGSSHKITLQDNLAAQLGIIEAAGMASVPALETAAGAPIWPAAIIVIGQNGSMVLTGNTVWDTSAMGPVLTSPNGHRWLLKVDNAGALSSATDLGTGVPALM